MLRVILGWVRFPCLLSVTNASAQPASGLLCMALDVRNRQRLLCLSSVPSALRLTPGESEDVTLTKSGEVKLHNYQMVVTERKDTAMRSLNLLFMFEKTMVRGLLAAAVIAASVAGPFSAVAVGGDTVYASIQGSGVVDKITSTGAVSAFATGLTNPTALVFDKAGNLYVGCPTGYIGQATICKITPQGVVSTYATGLTEPTALVFDGSGNLYAADEHSETVDKITPQGAVSTYATVGGEPEGLAFDSKGDLFVSALNADIYKVAPGGAVSLFVDTDQPWGTGLAIDGSNDLYMGDDAGYICKITPAGAVSTFASGTTQAIGVALGSGGTLYVADLGSRSVMEVGPAGGAMTALATGLTDVQYVAVPTPEPGTLALLAAGAAGLAGYTSWRRRKQPSDNSSTGARQVPAFVRLTRCKIR